MLFTTALAGSIVLAGGFLTAQAQEASSLFVIGFAGPSNELSGAIVGEGPESTTFILNGVEPAGATDVPFTITLVEGAQGISETIDIPAISSFGGEVNCGFLGGEAICTETASQGAIMSAETTTVPFTVDVAVTLTTGTPAASINTITAPGPTSPTPTSTAVSRFASSGWLPLLATTLSVGVSFWHLL